MKNKKLYPDEKFHLKRKQKNKNKFSFDQIIDQKKSPCNKFFPENWLLIQNFRFKYYNLFLLISK